MGLGLRSRIGCLCRFSAVWNCPGLCRLDAKILPGTTRIDFILLFYTNQIQYLF